MLISKKLLIASYIIKKQSNKKKLLGLIYSVIASSSIHSILIGCLLRQDYKKKLHLTHSFQVTWGIPHVVLFNSLLFSCYSILNSLFLETRYKIVSVRKNKSYYTVLRSPFVYKKSRESFFVEKYIGTAVFFLGSCNAFLVDFAWDIISKKILLQQQASLFIKKVTKYN